MVSRLGGELDKVQWYTQNGLFAQRVNPGDVRTFRVDFFQNSCQFIVVVMFELELNGEGEA